MKSKIKRHSRSALAVILTLSMLVSCMMVGLIATDAARVASNDTVAATAEEDSFVGSADYYLVGGTLGGTTYGWQSTDLPMTKAGSYYYRTISVYKDDYFSFYDGSNQIGGSSSDQTISADGAASGWTSTTNSTNAFKFGSNNGTYRFWYDPSGNKAWVTSGYVITGSTSNLTTWGKGIDIEKPYDEKGTYYVNIYLEKDVLFKLKNYSGEWFGGTNKADTTYYEINATSGSNSRHFSSANTENFKFTGDSGVYAVHVNPVSQYVWITEPVTQSYYLHLAENDNGMSGAEILPMTETLAGSGIFTCTKSNWDKTKMNVNVDTNDSNQKKETELSSIAAQADTGVSIDQATPMLNSDYYRSQFSLTKTPQNLSFSYDSSTKVLTVSGSVQKYTITAGGSSTGSTGGYKLRINGGTTTLNNYGGTNSAQFVDGKTLTVTVTPDLSNQKVSEIAGCSSVTDNGNGTYSGTITVSADTTITATLVNRASYTVTFTAGANGSVSATANGETLTSPATVLEGTKVTFNAAADDGYVFSAWSGGFTDSLSTVTKTITADTTVTGNFAKQGYKIVYQGAYGSSGKSMTEMSNGKYISSVTVGNGWYFRIADTGKSIISKGSGTPQALSANKEYKVTGWETTPESWNNTKAFSNNTGAEAYVVYDPVADKVYLTSESDGLFSSYDVYIKDGTVRYMDNSWDGFSADYGTTTLESTGTTLSVTASTVKKPENPNEDNYDGHVKKITLSAEQVRTGVDLHIKTAVNSPYQSSYYVKGFDVNGGLTQGIISQEFDADGNAKTSGYSDTDAGTKILTTYSNDFTLKLSGEKFPDGIIEVTPIYFPLSSKEDDFVRFYAYDFTEKVKKDWGGSLAVYPYIRDTYNPYGEYPGQLMVNEGGVYYSDIPTSYTKDNTTYDIQGLTMNNYIWDALHYDLFYKPIDQKENNRQTYDYNEFAIINDILKANNKQGEDIIFSFKYKDTVARADSNLGESTYYKNSYTNDPTRAKDYRNGYSTIEEDDTMYQWENLTDFYGNRVDIFGQLVDVTDNETKAAYHPIHIISNGYDDNKVGYYATAWALYKPVAADGSDAFAADAVVDHYELFEVMGGQGRTTDRDYPGESYLIDPEYSNRIKMKYGIETNQNDYKAALKLQMIAQGALDKNGKVITADTPDEDIKWPTHVMDCEYVPVVITYEYNIKSSLSNIDTGDSQTAYRSDGRWYYSDSNQLIKANTIVEVANSKSGPFVRDYFQPNNYDYKSGDNYIPTKNAGLNTGVKAYLTNSNSFEKNGVTYQNVSGNTQAYAISDGQSKYDYHFKAEDDPDGNYTFVGWYRLTESGTGVGYTLASEELEFSTEAKTNDVYVARFVKVPSGTLNISHSLTTDSRGSATCSAKAEILASDGTTVEDSTSYPYTEGTLKIGSKYIKSTSDKYIRITIKTELGANTLFDKFEEKITSTTDLGELIAGSGLLGITATVAIDTSETDKIATITFPINKLFTTADGETTQTVKTLPFYSKTYLPDYQYEIIYNYKSRKLIDNTIGKLVNNRLWGDQSYKSAASFTDEEVDTYLDLTADPKFKTEALEKEFIANHSPYEENFKENTTWDFDQASLTYSNDSNYKFSGTLTAQYDNNTTISVTFMMPFDYVLNTETANAYTFTVSNEVYKEYEFVENHDSINMDFLDWFSLNDVHNTDDMNNKRRDPQLIKVPDVLYNKSDSPDKKRVFQYWELINEVQVGSETVQKVYQKCYSSTLNIPIYQNSILKPVYSDEIDYSAPETKVLPTDQKTATITFLQNSRSQWNYAGGNGAFNGARFADRIFSDFVLSFQYQNKLIRGLDQNTYKAGIILQPISNAEHKSAAQLAEEATDNGTDGAIAEIKKTNVSTAPSDPSAYQVSYLDLTKLDPKNSVEYYYGLANVKQSVSPENDTYTEATERKNYGYRAYSFIKKSLGNGTYEVTISDPVYFTIYDIASIANGSKQTSN